MRTSIQKDNNDVLILTRYNRHITPGSKKTVYVDEMLIQVTKNTAKYRLSTNGRSAVINRDRKNCLAAIARRHV